MIVVRCFDPLLCQALRMAADVEEDVITEPLLVSEALLGGFARLLVRAGEWRSGGEGSSAVPLLDLDEATLRRWEHERRVLAPMCSRLEFVTERLRVLVSRSATDANWVDAALADLGRAAGARLPVPLRAFARRTMEYPRRYTSLHPIASACGITRGALKARFRRKGLTSPSVHLRWFRLMTVAHALGDRAVTVEAAAHALGFTSPGNLCRLLATLADLTPTEARTAGGWNKVVISFTTTHLTPSALDAWADLDGLFAQSAA